MKGTRRQCILPSFIVSDQPKNKKTKKNTTYKNNQSAVLEFLRVHIVLYACGMHVLRSVLGFVYSVLVHAQNQHQALFGCSSLLCVCVCVCVCGPRVVGCLP